MGLARAELGSLIHAEKKQATSNAAPLSAKRREITPALKPSTVRGTEANGEGPTGPTPAT